MTNKNQVANVNQKELTDRILSRVEVMKNDGLTIPQDYSPANALNIAYLQLEESGVINRVSPESVTKSLLNMVIQGLSPAKTQCYFIPYGNTLNMQRSYFGTQMAVKRLSNVEDIWANVIYEADEFDMEIDEKGVERFLNHKTNWLNRDGEIVGAYAIIETTDRGQLLTVMTRKEIEASWSQAKTKNVQNKFPQEMAKRTVINRAAKSILNTSNDSDHLINAINETTENEYDEEKRRRDVTEVEPDEKAKGLLNDFKKTVEKPVKEVKDESVGFTEKEVEELNNFSNEVYDDDFPFGDPNESNYADFEEVPEPEKAPTNDGNMTIAEIKSELDSIGVKYDSNMRKGELEDLLEVAQSGGVQDGLF